MPIAAAAYGFLSLIDHIQEWVFSDLPDGLGFDGEPIWWPIVPLLVAGFLVGAIGPPLEPLAPAGLVGFDEPATVHGARLATGCRVQSVSIQSRPTLRNR